MPLIADRAVTLTVPLAWQANGSENVRFVLLSVAAVLPSRPGPVAPPGIAPGVPGGTTPAAYPAAVKGKGLPDWPGE